MAEPSNNQYTATLPHDAPEDLRKTLIQAVHELDLADENVRLLPSPLVWTHNDHPDEAKLKKQLWTLNIALENEQGRRDDAKGLARNIVIMKQQLDTVLQPLEVPVIGAAYIALFDELKMKFPGVYIHEDGISGQAADGKIVRVFGTPKTKSSVFAAWMDMTVDIAPESDAEPEDSAQHTKGGFGIRRVGLTKDLAPPTDRLLTEQEKHQCFEVLRAGALAHIKESIPFFQPFKRVPVPNDCQESPFANATCPAADRFFRGVQRLGLTEKLLSDASSVVCFGWHGFKSDPALSPICHDGFDTRRRVGQAYGAGEYFTEAKSVVYSLNVYARNHRLIVAAILKGAHVNADRRKPPEKAGFIVVNNPRCDRPKTDPIPDNGDSFCMPLLCVNFEGASPVVADFGSCKCKHQ